MNFIDLENFQKFGFSRENDYIAKIRLRLNIIPRSLGGLSYRSRLVESNYEVTDNEAGWLADSQ